VATHSNQKVICNRQFKLKSGDFTGKKNQIKKKLLIFIQFSPQFFSVFMPYPGYGIKTEKNCGLNTVSFISKVKFWPGLVIILDYDLGCEN
jgi:hypothetical protein